MSRLNPDQAATALAAEKRVFGLQTEDNAAQGDMMLRKWCIEQALKANETYSRDIAVTARNIYKFMKGAPEMSEDA